MQWNPLWPTIQLQKSNSSHLSGSNCLFAIRRHKFIQHSPYCIPVCQSGSLNRARTPSCMSTPRHNILLARVYVSHSRQTFLNATGIHLCA